MIARWGEVPGTDHKGGDKRAVIGDKTYHARLQRDRQVIVVDGYRSDGIRITEGFSGTTNAMSERLTHQDVQPLRNLCLSRIVAGLIGPSPQIMFLSRVTVKDAISSKTIITG